MLVDSATSSIDFDLLAVGTVCVGVADFGGTSGKGSVQGDLLTLTSSMFYAAYTLAISHYLPRDEVEPYMSCIQHCFIAGTLP